MGVMVWFVLFPVLAYLLYSLSHALHRREVARERQLAFEAKKPMYANRARHSVYRPLLEITPEHFNDTVTNMQVRLDQARARRSRISSAPYSDEEEARKKAA